ncbi:hypothetical protein ACQEU3_24550 [Spirillospora sp. CA-253888]
MEHPTSAVAERTAPAHDPLAAALGNASLLGVGYLLLGRRGLAALAGAITLVLLAVVVSVARPWCEVVAFLWWAAVIAHGWFLAGGRTRRTAVRAERLTALAAAVPVLLALGFLRFDAARISGDVAEARADGDCARVSSAQDEVWFGHRVAAAPLADRGDRAVRACDRLRAAQERLAAGAKGDAGKLEAGYGGLNELLADPRNTKAVEVALNRFHGGLPAGDPCQNAEVSDWLRQRKPSRNVLDRSAGVVPQIEPPALAACGDARMKAEEWRSAKESYEELLDRYPGDARSAKARDGVVRATQSMELESVRELLDDSGDGLPEYCSAPGKYSAADAYRKGGGNRALFVGFAEEHTDRLPGGWRTDDVARAALVVCTDTDEQGGVAETCQYRYRPVLAPPGRPWKTTTVRFHRIRIPVKVYELRTGRKLADRKVEIGGSSCPRRIDYTEYRYSDEGPDRDQSVKPGRDDVRAAFEPLING